MKLFWTYRDCPVLLMDECDNLIRQEMTSNMLKQAFGPKRLLVLNSVEAMKNQRSYDEGTDKYDRSIPPPSFTLGENGRGIQLSNLDYTDPKVLDTLPRGHFDALVGRGADPIWIPGEELDDGIHLFHFTHWLATEGQMLRSSQLALYL